MISRLPSCRDRPKSRAVDRVSPHCTTAGCASWGARHHRVANVSQPPALRTRVVVTRRRRHRDRRGGTAIPSRDVVSPNARRRRRRGTNATLIGAPPGDAVLQQVVASHIVFLFSARKCSAIYRPCLSALDLAARTSQPRPQRALYGVHVTWLEHARDQSACLSSAPVASRQGVEAGRPRGTAAGDHQ